MELKSLSIRKRSSYETEKGFTGELETTSPTSEVKIRLSDAQCREILRIAGVGIKEAAAETAAFLISEASLVAEGRLLEVDNV
jgi:hypothetical protein